MSRRRGSLAVLLAILFTSCAAAAQSTAPASTAPKTGKLTIDKLVNQSDDWFGGEGKQIAYDWYRAKATRDDNGNLVIAGMPLAQYVKEHAPRSFKNFFASRDIG